MKQQILFILIIFILYGCDKDPIPPVIPTITTGDVTNIGYLSATANISITDISKTKEIGIFYSNSSTTPTSVNSQKVIVNSYNKNATLTGLLSGTTCYYRAYAFDGYSYIYGDVKTFVTLRYTTTIITTCNAYNLGYNSSSSKNPYCFSVSASIVGLNYVSSWGIMTSYDSGFSTYGYLAITDSTYVEGDVYTQDSWGGSISGLIYYRAYANLKNGGTIYGATKSVYVTY